MRYWAGAGVVLSLLLLETIRLIITASGPYSLFREFTSIYVPFPSVGDLSRIAIRATGLTWSVLLPLAALQMVHPPRVWFRQPALLVLFGLATAQTLVASDIERVVILGFPAIIAAAAFEIEYLGSHFALPVDLLWGAVFIGELPWLLGSFEAHGVPHLGQASILLNVLTVSAVVMAYVANRVAHGGAGSSRARSPS
jgi:hypothetical protein